ncbi:MAG: glycosyltransferase family 2 protein [Ectothiorhodospiraceae bacterium]|nr:glycosyltransferase family 2 protein [Ectothiorhodospiraceae bacterium]
MLADITPVVTTLDEAANIDRTLGALHWARRVVLVDSGSTDETLALAARHGNVEIHHRPFDCFAAQWNWALAHTGIDTEWVLALDADYLIPPRLVDEVARLRPPAEVAGYRARFRFRVLGRDLHGSLYPPVTLLVRRARAHYRQHGHAHRVEVDGTVRNLVSMAVHDDRKPLRRWVQSQSRYLAEEAALIATTPWRALGLADRVRRLRVVAPWLAPLVYLLARGGVLDGRAGLYYAAQRAIAEALLALYLAERAMIARRPDDSGDPE